MLIVDTKIYEILKFLNLIVYIRASKLLQFAYEVKEMQIILDTMKSLMPPIFWLISVQMIIFYFFA